MESESDGFLERRSTSVDPIDPSSSSDWLVAVGGMYGTFAVGRMVWFIGGGYGTLMSCVGGVSAVGEHMCGVMILLLCGS